MCCGLAPLTLDLLKALSNQTNRALLALLVAEPTYARKAATLLEISETEATRRLRLMEKLGVVESQWSHIGKNVKMYALATRAITVGIQNDGLHIALEGPRSTAPVVLETASVRVPDPGAVHGRDDVLAAIGTRPVTLLRGLPGIGKTSVAARAALDAGIPVFWYAFRGVESLDWLANRLGLFLAQHGDTRVLDAVQQDMAPAEKRERMLESVDEAEVFLAFDDVHNVEDPHVSAWLRDAAARTRTGRLLLVGREVLPQAALAHVQEIHLDGLTDAGVAAIVAEAGEDADAVPVLRNRFGGHPLAIRLALEAARRTGTPLRDVADHIPADGLDAYLLAEIESRLGDGERRLLAAACVFRTDFALADLRAVSSRIHRKDLLTMRRHGLVLDRGGGRATLHEVVRTYFYERLATKADFHRHAAKRFLDAGTVEGRLEAMHHYLAAGDQAKVLDLLENNLDLREFDFVDAGYTQLYLNMLRLLDDVEVGPKRALIEDEKGDLLLHRGEPAAALDHYAAARKLFVQQGNTARVCDVDWKRALALGRLGKHDEAGSVCQMALEAVEDDDPTKRRLEDVLATLA